MADKTGVYVDKIGLARSAPDLNDLYAEGQAKSELESHQTLQGEAWNDKLFRLGEGNPDAKMSGWQRAQIENRGYEKLSEQGYGELPKDKKVKLVVGPVKKTTQLPIDAFGNDMLDISTVDDLHPQFQMNLSKPNYKKLWPGTYNPGVGRYDSRFTFDSSPEKNAAYSLFYKEIDALSSSDTEKHVLIEMLQELIKTNTNGQPTGPSLYYNGIIDGMKDVLEQFRETGSVYVSGESEKDFKYAMEPGFNPRTYAEQEAALREKVDTATPSEAVRMNQATGEITPELSDEEFDELRDVNDYQTGFQPIVKPIQNQDADAMTFQKMYEKSWRPVQGLIDANLDATEGIAKMAWWVAKQPAGLVMDLPGEIAARLIDGAVATELSGEARAKYVAAVQEGLIKDKGQVGFFEVMKYLDDKDLLTAGAKEGFKQAANAFVKDWGYWTVYGGVQIAGMAMLGGTVGGGIAKAAGATPKLSYLKKLTDVVGGLKNITKASIGNAAWKTAASGVSAVADLDILLIKAGFQGIQGLSAASKFALYNLDSIEIHKIVKKIQNASRMNKKIFNIEELLAGKFINGDSKVWVMPTSYEEIHRETNVNNLNGFARALAQNTVDVLTTSKQGKPLEIGGEHAMARGWGAALARRAKYFCEYVAERTENHGILLKKIDETKAYDIMARIDSTLGQQGARGKTFKMRNISNLTPDEIEFANNYYRIKRSVIAVYGTNDVAIAKSKKLGDIAFDSPRLSQVEDTLEIDEQLAKISEFELEKMEDYFTFSEKQMKADVGLRVMEEAGVPIGPRYKINSDLHQDALGAKKGMEDSLLEIEGVKPLKGRLRAEREGIELGNRMRGYDTHIDEATKINDLWYGNSAKETAEIYKQVGKPSELADQLSIPGVVQRADVLDALAPKGSTRAGSSTFGSKLNLTPAEVSKIQTEFPGDNYAVTALQMKEMYKVWKQKQAGENTVTGANEVREAFEYSLNNTTEGTKFVPRSLNHYFAQRSQKARTILAEDLMYQNLRDELTDITVKSSTDFRTKQNIQRLIWGHEVAAERYLHEPVDRAYSLFNTYRDAAFGDGQASYRPLFYSGRDVETRFKLPLGQIVHRYQQSITDSESLVHTMDRSIGISELVYRKKNVKGKRVAMSVRPGGKRSGDTVHLAGAIIEDMNRAHKKTPGTTQEWMPTEELLSMIRLKMPENVLIDKNFEEAMTLVGEVYDAGRRLLGDWHSVLGKRNVSAGAGNYADDFLDTPIFDLLIPVVFQEKKPLSKMIGDGTTRGTMQRIKNIFSSSNSNESTVMDPILGLHAMNRALADQVTVVPVLDELNDFYKVIEQAADPARVLKPIKSGVQKFFYDKGYTTGDLREISPVHQFTRQVKEILIGEQQSYMTSQGWGKLVGAITGDVINPNVPNMGMSAMKSFHMNLALGFKISPWIKQMSQKFRAAEYLGPDALWMIYGDMLSGHAGSEMMAKAVDDGTPGLGVLYEGFRAYKRRMESAGKPLKFSTQEEYNAGRWRGGKIRDTYSEYLASTKAGKASRTIDPPLRKGLLKDKRKKAVRAASNFVAPVADIYSRYGLAFFTMAGDAVNRTLTHNVGIRSVEKARKAMLAGRMTRSQAINKLGIDRFHEFDTKRLVRMLDNSQWDELGKDLGRTLNNAIQYPYGKLGQPTAWQKGLLARANAFYITYPLNNMAAFTEAMRVGDADGLAQIAWEGMKDGRFQRILGSKMHEWAVQAALYSAASQVALPLVDAGVNKILGLGQDKSFSEQAFRAFKNQIFVGPTADAIWVVDSPAYQAVNGVAQAIISSTELDPVRAKKGLRDASDAFMLDDVYDVWGGF